MSTDPDDENTPKNISENQDSTNKDSNDKE